MDMIEAIRRDELSRLTAMADGYTGLDIVVMGLPTVISYTPLNSDEVCISISTDKWGGKPFLNDKFEDVLYLSFDDVAYGDHDDPTAKCIHWRDAQAVKNFVLKHREKSRLVIHCFAGASRSRSMAAAICDALELPYTYTAINQSVYTKVFSAFSE